MYHSVGETFRSLSSAFDGALGALCDTLSWSDPGQNDDAPPASGTSWQSGMVGAVGLAVSSGVDGSDIGTHSEGAGGSRSTGKALSLIHI